MVNKHGIPKPPFILKLPPIPSMEQMLKLYKEKEQLRFEQQQQRQKEKEANLLALPGNQKPKR